MTAFEIPASARPPERFGCASTAPDQWTSDLLREASNYGHTSSVGRLCIRAHDALYAIAIAVLGEER